MSYNVVLLSVNIDKTQSVTKADEEKATIWAKNKIIKNPGYNKYFLEITENQGEYIAAILRGNKTEIVYGEVISEKIIRRF